MSVEIGSNGLRMRGRRRSAPLLRGDGVAAELMPRTVAYAMALRGVGAVATFAFTVFVSRTLGANEYGLLALLQSWSAFLEVALGFGLPMYVARAVVKQDLSGPTGQAESLLTRARWATVLVGALVISVLFLGRGELTQRLAPEIGATWLIWMAAVLGLIRADIRLSSEGIKARFEATRGIALQFVYLPTAVVGALMAAWWAGTQLSAHAVTIIYIGVATSVAGVGRALWHITRPKIEWLAPGPPSSAKEPISSPVNPGRLRLAISRGRTAGFLWVFSLLDVAFPAVSLTLVGLFAGSKEVGIFGAASRIADLAGIGLAGVASIYGPRFARAYVQGDHRTLKSCLWTAQLWSLLLFAPVCMACLVIPGEILGIFGNDFVAGEEVLRILALGQLVNAGSGSVGVYLQMAGRERVGVWIGVASLIVLGLASAILGKRFGLTGLSIAYAVTVALKNCALYAVVFRLTQNPPAKSLPLPVRRG